VELTGALTEDAVPFFVGACAIDMDVSASRTRKSRQEDFMNFLQEMT